MMSPEDLGVVSAKALEIGRWRRADTLESFAYLRSKGCTITWAQEEKTLWSTTYYNFKLEGKRKYLEGFREWLSN